MRIYIWHRVDFATTNYHHEAAIVVTAETLAIAREAIRRYGDVPADCTALTVPPDEDYELDDNYPPDVDRRVRIFPDAGCC